MMIIWNVNTMMPTHSHYQDKEPKGMFLHRIHNLPDFVGDYLGNVHLFPFYYIIDALYGFQGSGGGVTYNTLKPPLEIIWNKSIINNYFI